MSTLVIDALSKDFGGVHAVKDVSVSVDRGRILGLIGPNGSGKTTLLNMIGGTIAPTAGRVLLDGADVSRLTPHRKVRRGIARTFQTTRLLADWTVRETLELARRARPDAPSAERTARIVGVEDDLDRVGSSLPSAVQRLVMIATALAAAPQVVLLDEPAVGMDVAETDHLQDVVARVRDELEASVIVVEHNMRFLMPLADEVVVMASGSVLSAGTPEHVRNDPAVIAAYLGS
ncbi:ABC transporter ATP-binding protein [Microbacterium hydrocarbonoxydans]|uniref:ABC transporter ATP-binding protein n=1 Tax=Microbacterium hydrocarbonoxydans TaxID=273678 RepID=UPI0007BBB1F0|nr:ATP-binding cassette domain-containing protein [Microbacterium hydrocarbonoxydans]GAT74345.1 ABC transporter related protein [Microbacterium sp. HM58-2]